MVINLITVLASVGWALLRAHGGRASGRASPFSGGFRKSRRQSVGYTDPFR
jgi:hypothetical protein